MQRPVVVRRKRGDGDPGERSGGGPPEPQPRASIAVGEERQPVARRGPRGSPADAGAASHRYLALRHEIKYPDVHSGLGAKRGAGGEQVPVAACRDEVAVTAGAYRVAGDVRQVASIGGE